MAGLTSRSSMAAGRGLLALVVLGALLLAQASRPASAFVIWCWDDPVVEIDGRIYAILVGVQGEPEDVRRDVAVARTTIAVPAGASYRVVSVTRTYFNETVRFVEDPGLRNRARVETSFQASADYPAALQLGGRILDQSSTLGRPLVATFPLN